MVAGILPCRSGVGRSSQLWVSHVSGRAGKPQAAFLPPYSPKLNPTAARVAKLVFDADLIRVDRPADVEAFIRQHLYKPVG